MYFPDNSRNAMPPVYQPTVPTTTNKTGLWRFLTPVRREKVSPCRQSCPLENNIPRWMHAVQAGNWEKAWSIIKEYNPFPAVTGYTCYRFCEDKCNRGFFDIAVHIGEVEKDIGLWRHRHYASLAAAAGKNTRPGRRGESPPRVAIVGSGPAGLSCAYYLNSLGAAVTIMEKMPLAGGLLATGIPEYRLPRAVLQKELEILQASGITIKTGMEIGKDLTLSDLQENFDAVLLAVGAQESKPLKVAGEHLAGVTGAVEFLRNIHLGKLKEIRGRAVVVGGGNAAVDAACAAMLQGAAGVTLLYRRSREAIPAHTDEIAAARKAGVEFVFHTVLQEISGSGKVQRLRAAHVAPSQRGEPLQILPETTFALDCDLVILAAGQESSLPRITSLSFTAENGGRILAAGDALNGPATVADAIFSGRKAALTLAAMLWPAEKEEPHSFPGIALPLEDKEPVVEFDTLNPHLFAKQDRCAAPQAEAGRCFSCGLCNNCGVCWLFCPDLAIADNGSFEILLDYCKGCGICVRECPAGVLEMVEVNSFGA